MSWRNFGAKIDKWLDECKMAGEGVVLATREKRFVVAFLISFVMFGTLLNLLAGGLAAFKLMGAAGFGGALKVLGDAFLANFGVGKNFWDFLLTFVLTILQSTLIALTVLVWAKKRRAKKEQVAGMAKNATNLQDTGLAAGLAILGSGCPTCGTTLLAPVISVFVSSGSLVLAQVVSVVLTVIAIFVMLWALKRMGRDAYAMIMAERWQKKQER